MLFASYLGDGGGGEGVCVEVSPVKNTYRSNKLAFKLCHTAPAT